VAQSGAAPEQAAAPEAGGLRTVVARRSLAPDSSARAVTVMHAGGTFLAQEWCGGSHHDHRALHVRQRCLRGAGLLLLLAESGLVLAAVTELADRRTEGRAVCRWCSVLNCAPLASWWDCSLYEVSLDDLGQPPTAPAPLPEGARNQTAPEPNATQGA